LAATPLAKRLQIKPGQRVLVLGAPTDVADRLGPLPDGVELSMVPDGTYDVVQVFVATRAMLARDAPAALEGLKPGGVLWFCYPKRSAKTDTDLTRDVGWNVLEQRGLRAVSQISVDDIWSALRFRPAPEAPARRS
jgi:hypothetical protein